MATPGLSVHDVQAASSPIREAHLKASSKRSTDDVFHLSPFPRLHDNTISHMCCHPSLSEPQPTAQPASDGIAEREDYSDDDDGNMASDANMQDLPESDIIVPPPNDPSEAYLLLAAARADRQVRLTRKELAMQIIHRNTLTLQYNRLLLEKAQEELHAADRLVGHVRFVIRKSGIPVAFECASRQDYTALTSSIQNTHSSSKSRVPSPIFDVKLD